MPLYKNCLVAKAASLATVLVVLILGTAAHARSQQTGQITIARIEVEGLQQLSAPEVIATSGLKIGQPFDIDTVDKATQRLADSGLFKKLQYRIRTNEGAATIIFVVEESGGGASPVVFDNFIWFSDEQLYGAVKREVPSFTGMAPDAGETLNTIATALKNFLKQHQIEATVEHMSSQSIGSSKQEHVFSVTGIALPICALHFPGTKNVAEAKLIAASQEILGTDFSRKIVGSFAVVRLFPIYREVGQLKARFNLPVAKPGEDGKCAKGVDLTIPVDEGLIYNWDKVAWSGNQVLTAQELDAALGMGSGEVANGLKFDRGVVEVRNSYGRKGYLEARVGTRPEFDDVGKRVSYNLVIKEGPQYRMGALTITGLEAAHEKIVRSKWPLKTGDIFDEGAFLEFRKKPMDEIMNAIAQDYVSQRKTPPTKVEISFEPDQTNLTVAVLMKVGFRGAN